MCSESHLELSDLLAPTKESNPFTTIHSRHRQEPGLGVSAFESGICLRA